MSINTWKEEYNQKIVSYSQAAQQIRSGDMVAAGLGTGSCSEKLFDAILDRHEELEEVLISDAVQIYPTKLYDPVYMTGLDGRINHMPIFGIATIRKMYKAQVSDFMPAMTLDAGEKYGERANVFLFMVTPPNKHGYINLGPTAFYTLETIKKGRLNGSLRTVIAEVNDQMPVVFGDNWLHVSEIDYVIERSAPIPAFKRGEASPAEKAIGDYVLDLIQDGATIQMGLGGISEAVAAGLKGKRDLGILTEMLPLALPQLVEEGIVTNARKPIYPGVSIASFVLGDENLYDYISENPSCQLFPGSYTNDPRFIARHPNMVAMNTSLMIDLTGNSTCEGIGHTQISGVGGQLDFIMGAYWSEGGKGINMLSAVRSLPDSTVVSTIVPELPPGTPVSVPRTYTNYVVTEYGIAQLRYKSRRERALELISIAHPDFRGELKADLKSRFYPKPS